MNWERVREYLLRDIVQAREPINAAILDGINSLPRPIPALAKMKLAKDGYDTDAYWLWFARQIRELDGAMWSMLCYYMARALSQAVDEAQRQAALTVSNGHREEPPALERPGTYTDLVQRTEPESESAETP